MTKYHSRRRRRQRKMRLASGGKFKIRHKAVSGRTGAVQSKRTPSGKRFVRRSWRPNPPDPVNRLGLS